MARTKRPQLWQQTACRLAGSCWQRVRRWVSGTRRQPNEDRLEPCLFLFFGWLFGRPLERGAQDVAECRAGIGRAVLRDRLFLLRHFERLDGHLDLVGAAIELDDPSIDLLSDGETLRPLLAAIARQLRAL